VTRLNTTENNNLNLIRTVVIIIKIKEGVT